MEGTVFNIKRYAVHDGPGIRTTVFLKGCPLSCPWCQNPEGIRAEPELIWRRQRCIGCKDCEAVCPRGAVSFQNSSVSIDKDLCDLCGLCGASCNAEALEVVGRRISVEEVIAEVEKDRVFYHESRGGVTVSGGEPLMQAGFLEGILKACTKAGLHTAVDTSGYADRGTLLRIAEYADLFLWDIKLMDEKAHREHTGVSNGVILENLKALSGMRKPTIIRFSLIPGVNDSEFNLEEMGRFMAALDYVNRIDILPYHKGWVEKYKGLNPAGEAAAFEPPSTEALKAAETKLAEFGLKTRIGG
jgi:pyruvate formate lyase activating enzyme